MVKIMIVACVIPARLESSRFPQKLLKKANGKSVLQYTFEKARECKQIDSLFVATDSEVIADHVRAFGGKVILTGVAQNGTMRIVDAIEKEKSLQKAKYIINLQGDHPCTSPKTLSAIIRALELDEMAQVSTAITKIQKNTDFYSPHIVKCVFDSDLNALYFSRSPIPYHSHKETLKAYAHIGVYCYRTPFLKNIRTQKKLQNQKCEDLEQLGILENGHRIKLALVEEEILGIDTPKDLERFKKILCRKSNISLSQAELSPL